MGGRSFQRLSYHINGGKECYTDVRFPVGMRLRPWALLGLANTDSPRLDSDGESGSDGESAAIDEVRISGWVHHEAEDVDELGIEGAQGVGSRYDMGEMW